MRLVPIFFLVSCFVLQGQTIQTVLNNGGHSSKVYDMAYTDFGELISVGADKSIRFWDPVSKENQVVYLNASQGSNDMLFALAISEDQKWIAVGGFPNSLGRGIISFVDIEKRRQIGSVETDLGVVTSIAIGQSGLLAAGDHTGNVWILDVSDVRNPMKIGEIKKKGEIRSLAFSPTQDQLVISTGSGDVILMDYLRSPFRSGAERKLSKHYLPVNKVVFDRQGEFIYTGGADGYLHRFNRSGNHVDQVDRFGGSVSDIDISSDGSLLVAGTITNGVCKSYNLTTNQKLAEFTQHKNTVYSVAISNKDERSGFSVTSSGGDQSPLMVWNPYTGEKRFNLGGTGNTIWDLKFASDDELLISTRGENTFFNKAFNFSNQLLKSETGQAIGEPNVPASVGSYMIRINGNVFENNRLIDGRLLSYCVLNQTLFLGSDFSLKAYDLTNGDLLREYNAHSGGVRSLATSPDGRYLASGGEDQVIHLWKLGEENENPFLSFYLDDQNEWVCWNSLGYFNSSSKGDQFLGWLADQGDQTEASFFSVAQYFTILFRPEEVAESFTSAISIADILLGKGQRVFMLDKLNKPSGIYFDQPATVQDMSNRGILIKKTSSTFVTENSTAELSIEAIDGGAGISEIRIFQNDKLVINDKVNSEGSGLTRIRRTYQVSLLPGRNKFKSIVLNEQNVESYPSIQYIEYTGQIEAVSDLYVLAIGINQYLNSSYNLNYAKTDAESFVAKLQSSSAGIFENIHVRTLYNDEADRPGIIEQFQQIKAQTKIQDVFIFYYAGHGTIDPNDPDNYYLVPHDITQIYGGNVLKEKGISSGELREFLAKIDAQKQLVILDACQSGGAVQLLAMRGTPEEKAIIQLARSSGTVLLSASGSEQYAVEFDKLGHGVFTYALLEALEGKADGGNQDKKITVNELKAYLEDRVPELSLEHSDHLQFPTGFSAGQDFPIAIIKDDN